MTFTTIVRDILVETIAKIIGNLAWFILIYWSVKTLVKKAPTWLDQYEKIRMKQRAIDNALSKRFIR